MDEIRKIPPVTRLMLAATGAITLPCILAITSPYRFALFWPLVTRKYEIHRIFTSFFYGGGGLKLLFDLFILYRNSNDLELNHFGRRTADYTWSLLVMGVIILATNYPLGSPIFFGPLLNALVYVWARANPSSIVSFFGMVNVPARWLPYVNIGLDLLQGGPGLAIQSGTGLLAGYVYWLLDQVLPARRGGGGRGGGRGGSYIPTPGFLYRLMPDSVDPALAGHAMGDRNARRVAGGTAWNAARDRGHRLSDRSSGSATPRPTSIASALGAGVRSTMSAVNPFAGRSTSTRTNAGPNREEMLAAAERRLRASQGNSIVGRNASERPAKAAGSNTPGTTSLNARPGAGDSTTNLRKTAAASGQSNMFTFGQLAEKQGSGKEAKEEDHSSSGGAVAEQRWGQGGKGKGKARDSDDEGDAGKSGGSTGYSWGTGGQRLGD
ncbi:Derlin [Kalmanozyma brasiliensis GHG001]|uniref:Derlin n=1 Tax=Kalmanozyma brasiliensis (strain GHG001) TaxID=1365824 RepID=V5EUG1_KALBG|nr:Derlin [Kalmanozyma brasiliensis GHG001]EST05749.1 Derlin [Kalmanozyma brasiliensis GHG001]